MSEAEGLAFAKRDCDTYEDEIVPHGNRLSTLVSKEFNQRI